MYELINSYSGSRANFGKLSSYVLSSPLIWTCRIMKLDYLYWFFQCGFLKKTTTNIQYSKIMFKSISCWWHNISKVVMKIQKLTECSLQLSGPLLLAEFDQSEDANLQHSLAVLLVRLNLSIHLILKLFWKWKN